MKPCRVLYPGGRLLVCVALPAPAVLELERRCARRRRTPDDILTELLCGAPSGPARRRRARREG